MKMIASQIFYYLVLIFAALFLYVRLYEAKGIFLPNRKVAVTPQDAGLAYEDVFFVTPDQVKLNAWLIKTKTGAVAATIIFLHGNAGNISHRLDKIALLHKLGLNVFIVDYRGYGKSQGQPSEKGIYADAAVAYDYLKSRKDIDGEKILLYGESLGGVAAIDLACHRPIVGLITESTFTSARDMAKSLVPFVPTFLLQVKLDSISKIKTVVIPKLFIHSRQDEIVPFKLAQRLFDAAPQPKEFLEIDGDHNGGYSLSYEKYSKGIEMFLQKNRFVR